MNASDNIDITTTIKLVLTSSFFSPKPNIVQTFENADGKRAVNRAVNSRL